MDDLAFELLVLTAARANELLEAKWGEIDLEQACLDSAAEPHEGGQGASVGAKPSDQESS